jgi:hypothetical protein
MQARLLVLARAQIAALALLAFPLAAAAPAATGARGAAVADPAYVTPLVAHTAWTATDGCQPFTGVLKLPSVLSGHASRGYSLSGTIVTSWLAEKTRTCLEPLPLQPFPKPILMPSWTDLAKLRAIYPGFDLVSASVDYADMTQLTPAEQQAEACGSRDTLVAHGVTAPIALFAYPNNHYTPDINALVLGQCSYRLGRRYGNAANTPTTVQSGFLTVYSINGGRCSDASLPCSTLPTRYVYTSRADLASHVHPAPGTWVVPQFYRLVKGTSTSGRLQWNCLGPQPSHYTYDTGGDSTELYCANDYYGALANQQPNVRLDLTIGQVETLFGVPDAARPVRATASASPLRTSGRR